MFDVMNMVRLFNNTGGQTVRDVPTFPIPVPEMDLRYALIAEEVQELQDAYNANDFQEIIDACADIVYVSYGAALSYGVTFDPPRDTHSDTVDKAMSMGIAIPSRKWLVKLYIDEIRMFTEDVLSLTNNLKDADPANIFSNVEENMVYVLRELIRSCYNISACFGFDLDLAVKEVQDSNMSKFGPNLEVYLREDGKIKKGPNYFAPNLAKVIQDQGIDIDLMNKSLAERNPHAREFLSPQ